MITFDRYALEAVIDERVADSFDFRSVYGADLFDKEGKVGYHNVGFQPGHLIDVLQNQQYQISKLEDKISNLYNEINNLYKTKEERNE
tara:strand:- start:489 stop:752 length:264 start_codon:yes stop_codon:yes gene_type:complete